MDLFNCKIAYLAQNEDGKIKKVSDIYEVQASGFTEAEARLQEVLEESIASYDLLAMKKSNIKEVVIDQSKEKFFQTKVSFVAFDEDNGKESKDTNVMLVQSNSVEEATKVVNERMKGSISDYHIKGVSETKVVDVFLRG